MNALNLFFGAIAAGDVRGVQNGLGNLLSLPNGPAYANAFGEALLMCRDSVGGKFLQEVTDGKVPDIHFYGQLPPHYLENAGMLLARSDGPTANFFSKTDASVLNDIRQAMGTARDVFLRETHPVQDKLLALLGEREALLRQHYGRYDSYWLAPSHETGPLAGWFEEEKRDALGIMMQYPSAFAQGLITLMGNPNRHDRIANMAQGLAILLAENNDSMLEAIVKAYPPSPQHPYSDPRYYGVVIKIVDPAEALITRLLFVLSQKTPDRRLRNTLTRILMKHPKEERRFRQYLPLIKFDQPKILDLAPRNGRDHLVIAAVSDLHNSEYNAEDVEKVARRLRFINPDVLIIAGDVANSFEYFGKTLDLLSGRWAMLVIAGNHDVWSAAPEGGPTSAELWEKVLPAVCDTHNAIWLEENPVLIPAIGLGIVGTIGWYNYSGERLGRPLHVIAAEKGRAVQDADRIDWKWDDITFATARQFWLRRFLSTLSSGKSNNGQPAKEIMVVTHMVPFAQLKAEVESDPRHADFFNRRAPYYFNTELGDAIRMWPRVRWTISGHNHQGKTVTLQREGLPPLEAKVLAESDTKADGLNEIAVYRFPLTKKSA